MSDLEALYGRLDTQIDAVTDADDLNELDASLLLDVLHDWTTPRGYSVPYSLGDAMDSAVPHRIPWELPARPPSRHTGRRIRGASRTRPHRQRS